MIRAVRLLAIYVCRYMVYMITCRFHGFCIAANESMSEWKPSSPSMAAASNGMSSAAVIAGLPPGMTSPTAGMPLLKSTFSWVNLFCANWNRNSEPFPKQARSLDGKAIWYSFRGCLRIPHPPCRNTASLRCRTQGYSKACPNCGSAPLG